MTDTSSQGLLPQLTEVLHALTESHELLTRKIRELHVRESSTPVDHYLAGVAFSTESTEHTESAEPTDLSTHLYEPLEEFEISWTTAGHDPSPNVDFEMNAPRATSPAQIETAARDSSAPPHAEAESYRESGRTDAASVSHDYNFFDELDARLANIETPAQNGGTR